MVSANSVHVHHNLHGHIKGWKEPIFQNADGIHKLRRRMSAVKRASPTSVAAEAVSSATAVVSKEIEHHTGLALPIATIVVISVLSFVAVVAGIFVARVAIRRFKNHRQGQLSVPIGFNSAPRGSISSIYTKDSKDFDPTASSSGDYGDNIDREMTSISSLPYHPSLPGNVSTKDITSPYVPFVAVHVGKTPYPMESVDEKGESKETSKVNSPVVSGSPQSKHATSPRLEDSPRQAQGRSPQQAQEQFDLIPQIAVQVNHSPILSDASSEHVNLDDIDSSDLSSPSPSDGNNEEFFSPQAWPKQQPRQSSIPLTASSPFFPNFASHSYSDGTISPRSTTPNEQPLPAIPTGQPLPALPTHREVEEDEEDSGDAGSHTPRQA